MGVRSTLWTSRAAAKSPSVSWPALFQDRSWGRSLGAARPSSGMLRRYRRFFAVAAFLVLATPLVAGLVYPDGAASILMEGRTPAPAPRAPVDSADWFRLPKQIDAYLQDHIGLRQALLHAHRELSKPLFGSYKVLMGRGGRMFYLGNEMVLQSAGLVMRDQAVAIDDRFARADERRASSAGHPFSGRAPAERLERFTDDLPLRAQNPGRPTEYDLLTVEPRRQRRSDCRFAARPQGGRPGARSIICTIRIGPCAARSSALTQLSRRIRIPIGGSIRRQPWAGRCARAATWRGCSASRTKYRDG